MRDDLDHLKPKYQRELALVAAVLREEFARLSERKVAVRKKNARIVKIILFGSFTSERWIDDKISGYKSDYDILVIVNDEEFSEVADYWYTAEDRLRDHPHLQREVGLIVHSLSFVNDALRRSKYFFVDIYKQGIELYEHPRSKPLKKPGPLNAEQALEEAEEHYDYWLSLAKSFQKTSNTLQKDQSFRHAAFELHQAVESLYRCYLLVRTNYTPDIHNIEALGKLCHLHDPRFIDVFPGENRRHRRAFQRLKNAYVKGRYSKHYKIEQDELVWLGERVDHLTTLTKAACTDHIAALKADV